MRGESMKGKSKKSTYSTTFGVDPFFSGAFRYEGGIAHRQRNRVFRNTDFLSNIGKANPFGTHLCYVRLFLHIRAAPFDAPQTNNFAANAIFADLRCKDMFRITVILTAAVFFGKRLIVKS